MACSLRSPFFFGRCRIESARRDRIKTTHWDLRTLFALGLPSRVLPSRLHARDRFRDLLRPISEKNGHTETRLDASTQRKRGSQPPRRATKEARAPLDGTQAVNEVYPFFSDSLSMRYTLFASAVNLDVRMSISLKGRLCRRTYTSVCHLGSGDQKEVPGSKLERGLRSFSGPLTPRSKSW